VIGGPQSLRDARECTVLREHVVAADRLLEIASGLFEEGRVADALRALLDADAVLGETTDTATRTRTPDAP
jgi:hypothetical protein